MLEHTPFPLFGFLFLIDQHIFIQDFLQLSQVFKCAFVNGVRKVSPLVVLHHLVYQLHQLLHLSFLLSLLCVSAVTECIAAVSTLLEEAS